MITVLQIISVVLLLQLLFAVWNAAQLPKLGVGRAKGIQNYIGCRQHQQYGACPC